MARARSLGREVAGAASRIGYRQTKADFAKEEFKAQRREAAETAARQEGQKTRAAFAKEELKGLRREVAEEASIKGGNRMLDYEIMKKQEA